MQRSFLLITVISLLGCGTEAKRGTFSVTFAWQDEPPTEALWVFARVERDDGQRGRIIVAEAAVAEYEPGVVLKFDVVPNGEGYIVVVELKQGDTNKSRTRYFGESEPFSLKTGKHTEVKVAIALIKAPNGVENAVTVVEAQQWEGRVNDTNVTLLLQAERASGVIVANDIGFSASQQECALKDLETTDRGWLWKKWDLDSGLCTDPPCEDGIRTVFVKFLNDSGFESVVHSAQVTIDRTIPDLVESSISPTLANSNSEVSIRIEPSEALSEPPSLRANPSGPILSMPEQIGQSYLFRYAVDENATEGVAYRFWVDLIDRAGNRSESLSLEDTFTVDRTPPTVVSSRIDSEVVSASDSFTFRITTSELLDEPARIFVDAQLVDDCEREQDNESETYRCEVSAKADEQDGIRRLSAEMVDLAGNRASVDFGSVRYDVDLPISVGSLLRREPEYEPAQQGDRTWFSSLDPVSGDRVHAQLSVYANKKIVADPILEVTHTDDPDTVLDFQLEDRDEKVVIFDYAMSEDDTPGIYTIAIVWRDDAGNQRREQLPNTLGLAVDPMDNEIDQKRTLYQRIPWGAQESNGEPHYSLVGELIGFSSAVEVIVKSSPMLGAGYVIGRAQVSNGRFEIESLSGGNLSEVYAATVDHTGNISDFVRIIEGEWIATVGAKQAGSTAENPHTFYDFDRMPGSLFSSDSYGVREPSMTPLARRDFSAQHADSAVNSRGALQWLLYGGTTPDLLNEGFVCPTAFDSSRGRIVMVGLMDEVTDRSLNFVTWEWDGRQWYEERSASATISFRFISALAYENARGKTLLFGGASSEGTFRNDTWEWDGARWREVTPAGLSPAPRIEHHMVYDSYRERVILFGGYSMDSSGAEIPLNDTWEWDGKTWTNVTPQQSPSPRKRHAMAYDQARQEVVLFGGNSEGEYKGDTWVWNGDVWMERRANQTSPSARLGHAMAYDQQRRQVILFGGEGSDGRRSDTWAWDGNRWLQVATEDEFPSTCCINQSLAYDSIRDRIILTAIPDSSTLVNTWEWDGEQWTDVTPDSTQPEARNYSSSYDGNRSRAVLTALSLYDARPTLEWDGRRWYDATPTANDFGRRWNYAQAYDGKRKSTLIFGGEYSNDYYNDLFEWNGTDWTNVTPLGVSPPGRSGAMLTYDTDTENMILFGGYASGDYFSDTWLWDGQEWIDATPDGLSPPARRNAHFVFDSIRGRAILAGGYADPEVCDESSCSDLWEWDGSRWQEIDLEEQNPLTICYNHYMVYDSYREQLILLCQDPPAIWRFDGTRWREEPCLFVQPLVEDVSVVYDSVHEQVVMFTGINAVETWGLLSRSRPGHIFHVSTNDLGADPSRIDSIMVTADSGAKGYRDNAIVNGVKLSAWNGFKWIPLSCNAAASEDPDTISWTTRDPEMIKAMHSIQGLHFAITPRGENGPEFAKLTTDYIEVRVRYHLEGEGSVLPLPGSFGTPSAVCP